jgi:ABC-type antimicrobial peptide transport system permease subunit
MVVLRGVRVAIAGSALGLAAAAALGRVVSALLYHASATDWMSFTAAALVLVAVAAAASYVAARRAAARDPMQALRSE